VRSSRTPGRRGRVFRNATLLVNFRFGTRLSFGRQGSSLPLGSAGVAIMVLREVSTTEARSLTLTTKRALHFPTPSANHHSV